MDSIEQLASKIDHLQSQIDQLLGRTSELVRKSEQALDQSLHAFKVDRSGYLWTWSVEEQKYNKTNMRILLPESQQPTFVPENI